MAGGVLTAGMVKPHFPLLAFPNLKMNREGKQKNGGLFALISPMTKSSQVSTWQQLGNLCSSCVTFFFFFTLSLNPYLQVSLRQIFPGLLHHYVKYKNRGQRIRKDDATINILGREKTEMI